MGGRGRGSYARYGGGGKGSRGGGLGRGPHQLHGYSDIRDKEPQNTAILKTQEDIKLDSESERSANWKEQVF